jgi:hypothetical protein
MALLTQFQYKKLAELHNREFQNTRKDANSRILATYLNQAEDFINQVANIPKAKFNEQTVKQTFTYLDIKIDEYNQEIYPLFQSVQKDLTTLGYDQTGDYYRASNDGTSYFSASELNDMASVVVNSIAEPIPGSSFKLSSAIWEENKKDAIYQWVLDQISYDYSYTDIVDQLAAYLTDTQQGSAYFKAYRVVDTEVIRSFVYSNYASTIDYNRVAPNQLVIIREVSPMHRVTDICDALAGIYIPELGFPAVPSHPFCICLVTKKFAKDIDKSKIKTVAHDGKGYVDLDDWNYKDAPFLLPSWFGITPEIRGGGDPFRRGFEIETDPITLRSGIDNSANYIKLLQDLGVYEEQTLAAPVKDPTTGKILRNANRFDQMMNNITQKVPREKQKEAILALQAILDPNDPYAMNAVAGTINTYLKFFP